MEEKTFKDADETVRGPEAATAADPAEAPAPVTEAAEVPAAEDTADIPDADQAPANLAVRDDLSPEGGELRIRYTLDLDAHLSSDNEILVRLKKCGSAQDGAPSN